MESTIIRPEAISVGMPSEHSVGVMTKMVSYTGFYRTNGQTSGESMVQLK